MPYRVLALDLDGTLTNSDKVITPRTRQALLDAADAGTTIVLASLIVIMNLISDILYKIVDPRIDFS